MRADICRRYAKKVLAMEEFEGPHGNYTPEIGPLHVNYVLKCIWWKQLEVAHENICCVNALPMQTLRQIFKKNRLEAP